MAGRIADIDQARTAVEQKAWSDAYSAGSSVIPGVGRDARYVVRELVARERRGRQNEKHSIRSPICSSPSRGGAGGPDVEPAAAS